MLTIPKEILIGPYRVTVGPLPEELVRQGISGDYEKRHIRIALELESPAYILDTLLHEIIHAIHIIYEVDQENEEQLTVITATTLVATLLHTPDLLRYINDVFRSPHDKVLHKIG